MYTILTIINNNKYNNKNNSLWKLISSAHTYLWYRKERKTVTLHVFILIIQNLRTLRLVIHKEKNNKLVNEYS